MIICLKMRKGFYQRILFDPRSYCTHKVAVESIQVQKSFSKKKAYHVCRAASVIHTYHFRLRNHKYFSSKSGIVLTVYPDKHGRQCQNSSTCFPQAVCGDKMSPIGSKKMFQHSTLADSWWAQMLRRQHCYANKRVF